MPAEPVKTEDDKKKDSENKKAESSNAKCKEDSFEDCGPADPKLDKNESDPKKPLGGRKLRRPRKNRKALQKPEQGQCFFPMSMSMLYGPLGDQIAGMPLPSFPYNVTFKQVSFYGYEILF